MYTQGNTAFQVNDYILHGGSGVCKILDICIPSTHRADPSKTYYRLLPVYEKGSIIYTPTDNSKSILRRILSREEALALVRHLPELDPLWIDNEKSREEIYRSTLRTNDCVQWLRVIKTLHLHNHARLQEGKKLSQTDEKYLRIAEDLLFGELSISLETTKEKVGEFIGQQLHLLLQPGEACS